MARIKPGTSMFHCRCHHNWLQFRLELRLHHVRNQLDAGQVHDQGQRLQPVQLHRYSFGPILDWAERVSNKCLKSNNFSHITRLVAWTSWTDSRSSIKSTNHLKSFVEKFYKCSLTWLAHTKLQDRFTIAALLRTEQGLLLWLFKKQLT